MDKITFPTGIYQLNQQPNFDFQLNRVIMWDGGDLEDIREVADRIDSSESWKANMIAIGDKANAQGRTKQAIAYYRMSEFFMYDGDPDKEKYYTLATDMFYQYYDAYFTSGRVQRHQVAYEAVKLPVMLAKASGTSKGAILLHGGNDSYFEELFFAMLYLVEHSYDVYLFEGPGQGGVLRKQKKHFTPKWERPVGAVLDHFGITDVTIVGASLGGALAPRAAASISVFPRWWPGLCCPTFFMSCWIKCLHRPAR